MNGFYFYQKLLDRINRIFRIILTVFHLPAIASRSGEAGGDENGQTQCATGAIISIANRAICKRL
jgi:hypothetical protein